MQNSLISIVLLASSLNAWAQGTPAAPQAIIERTKAAIRGDGTDKATIRVRVPGTSSGLQSNYTISVSATQGTAQFDRTSTTTSALVNAGFRVSATGTQDLQIQVSVNGAVAGTTSIHVIAPRAATIQDYADCVRTLQARRPRNISGLPFGTKGMIVLKEPYGSFSSRFPDLMGSVLLVKDSKLFQLDWPEVGHFAPQGDEVADTIKIEVDGQSYYAQKGLTGGIGAAWDLNKQPLQTSNPDAIATFRQDAYNYFTQKLRASTGSDHVTAKPLDLAAYGSKAQDFLASLADTRATDLKYTVRDERITDQAGFDAILGVMSNDACALIPELDTKREDWADLAYEARRVLMTSSSTPCCGGGPRQ